MTDQQAADRATQIRVFTEGTSSGDVKPVSVDYMRSLASDFDALSARLAQAEQERGEAWDKADFEAEVAEKAEASLRDVETRLRAMELSRDEANHRYDVERRRGDAIRRRLRKYEERPVTDLRHAQVDDIASGRVAQMFREAPRPWSATSNNDGNHELVDANGAPIAQSPMFGWLRAIAEVVNGGASGGGREAP